MTLMHTNPMAKVSKGTRRPVTAKTGDYTLTKGESGGIFTTEGAAGAVNFTLPAPEAGLNYLLYCAEDQTLTLTPNALDNLIVFNNVAADAVAFSTTSEKAGGAFYVFSDGVKWMAMEMIHDAQTAVVTSA